MTIRPGPEERPSAPSPAPSPRADGAATETSDALDELEGRLGYRFADRRLLLQAMTHKSYAHESAEENGFHNESLEFLGDAVVGLVVTDLVFRSFPEASEGRKSKIKGHLVSATTLAALAADLGLPRYLRLGKGEEKTGGRKKKALGANAFEAVIGAVYLDGGLEAARRVLEPVLEPRLRAVREGREVVDDPKTALQELLQATNRPAPQYVVTAETGPEHRKSFHVDVVIEGRTVASATGPTKKRASLAAAQTALERLRAAMEAEESSIQPPPSTTSPS